MNGVPEATTPHETIFHAHGCCVRAIRSGDYKLNEGNLYNLITDVAELTPLNGSEPDKLQELSDLLDAGDSQLKGNKRDPGVAEYTPQ